MVPVAAACMGCAHDNINPHRSLPHGERHARTRRVPTVARFNPRPRAGSDVAPSSIIWRCTASIHAPARGATQPEPSPKMPSLASIHAPARGATVARSVNGERPTMCPTTKSPHVASIHAPARGATQVAQGGPYKLRASIHAPARGATVLSAADAGQISASIHAPARGATKRAVAAGEEGNASIHAPARGAPYSR